MKNKQINIGVCYFDIIIIEEMYYSPRKNIQTFIETKNEQIKSLKQKILGSRVTYEDMESAKTKLASLKNSQVNLGRQDHLELKQVLKTSQQAINDLVKRKNRLFEEFEDQQKQFQQATDLEVQLLNKKQKADQFYREVCDVKQKLIDRNAKKSAQIQQLEEEITIRKKQLAMERDIADQLQVAKVEVKAKMSKVNKDVNDLAQDNLRLKQSIRRQLEQITRLQHQAQSDQLRTQNLQLKIEKQQKNCQNLQHKIDAAQTFMQRYSEDRLIYLKQNQTSQNIQSLLKMCTESNQKKQKQQRQCQQDINELIRKIEASLNKRQRLAIQLKQKQENLNEMKEKGVQLKSILNSIFHQDSSVLKLLADKKVFESEEKTKKQNSVLNSPTGSKIKHDMLDMLATSDNFFMTAN